jgi:hypothetical protein
MNSKDYFDIGYQAGLKQALIIAKFIQLESANQSQTGLLKLIEALEREIDDVMPTLL